MFRLVVQSNCAKCADTAGRRRRSSLSTEYRRDRAEA